MGGSHKALTIYGEIGRGFVGVGARIGILGLGGDGFCRSGTSCVDDIGARYDINSGEEKKNITPTQFLDKIEDSRHPLDACGQSRFRKRALDMSINRFPGNPSHSVNRLHPR